MKINQILKDSHYRINPAIFDSSLIEDLEDTIYEKKTKKGKAFYTKCIIREKEIKLIPEEVIRQLFLRKLLYEYEYPKDRIIVEYPVHFGREVKKADIAIMDRVKPTVPFIIVELKKPRLKEGKEQLKSYTNATGAPIAVWTNGERIEYFHRKDPNYFEHIPNIPKAHQSLRDILKQKFTIEDLKKVDKLRNEKVSLKDIILELEDEILANAGVDVFEEVFKLILTKLYDELQSIRDPSRDLEFRNYGESDPELKEKIQKLFEEAIEEWEGIFPKDSKIELSPSHLAICVSSFQDIKIFNTNLDVIDDAFEYLVNKTSKGEKGQYFTPRYVIDMAVKMINPSEDESIIDPACGSFGFPLHAVFHVWKNIYKELGKEEKELLTAEEKHPRAIRFVEKKIFGIDFDEKVVRVAKLLNLIAGDGHSNVIKLNSLDYDMWNEWIEDEDWRDKYYEGWKKLKKLLRNRKSYRDFNFDIVLTNPPFAGEIKESRIIHRYNIAQKKNGKYPSKISRDILFIERALQLLKPGGRMAIVLPQGRLNNATDKHIREFISEHARILAVIGLHQNVFKPHTGTKTSILFLQKWDDKLCPKVDDYPIFFATMQEPSKDNSGEKIYVTYKDFLKWEEEGKIPPLPEEFKKKALENPEERVLDKYGHLIVKHDLYSVETYFEGVKTPEGIAEAFLEFARKEKLSFIKKNLTLFDEKKYKRLMDRLEAVELKVSEVKEDNPDFRIDSEHYKKIYFYVKRKVAKYPFISLKECVSEPIKTGHTPSMKNPRFYGGHIKFIKTDNLREFEIKEEFEHYLSDLGNEKIKRTFLREEDLLLTIIGADFNVVGRCTIANNSILPANINQNIALIRINREKISPYYVASYLNSKYGRLYIFYLSRQTEQVNLNTSEVGNIRIPLFSQTFQQTVEKIVKTAYQKLEKSKTLYKEAEEILLQELELKNFKPTSRNYNIVHSKSTFLNGRLDAEYYLPKYEEILNHLKQFPLEPLGKIVNIKKSIEPGSKYYQDEGTPFIRVSDFSKFGIDTPKVYLSPNFLPQEEIEKLKPKKGTILLTKDGTVGISYVVKYPYEEEVITSNAILHLRIKKSKQKEYLSEYLSLVLNSVVGQMQAERDTGGSLIQHWRLEDIKRVLIPKLDKPIQLQIEELINKSFQLRKESKELLEKAKKLVEIAIEEGEEKALKILTMI